MKNRVLVSLCLVLTLGFVGCFKSISHDTTYVIRPTIQLENKGVFTSLAGVRAYAFLADTSQWRVASYDDALAGILTSKINIQERMTTPSSTSEPYPVRDTIPSSVNWIQMHLDAPSMMIVAIDAEHKLYAYRQQLVGENLPEQNVVLQFRSWSNSYRESGWQVINQFYVKPEDPKPETPTE